MRWALVALILLSQAAIAQEQVSEDWYHHIQGGVQGIYVLDVDGEGGPEAYAVSVGERTMVYAYDLEGNLLYETVASREGGQESGKEETYTAAVSDIDRNGFPDIVTSAVINAGLITDHRLYRFQRMPDVHLKRTYTRLEWMVRGIGQVTSISFRDVDGDGKEEIITSSMDDTVRVFAQNGSEILNITTEFSLWHVTPVPPAGNASELKNKTVKDYSFLAGGYGGMTLVDARGYAVWNVSSGDKYENTIVADLKGDGIPQYIGYSNGMLRSYDNGGNEIWTAKAEKTADLGTVGIQKNRYLVVASDDMLLFLDKEGKELLRYRLRERAQAVKVSEEGANPMIIVGLRDGIQAVSIDMGFFIGKEADATYAKALAAFAGKEYNISAEYARSAYTAYDRMSAKSNASDARYLEMKALDIALADDAFKKAEKYAQEGKYAQAEPHLKNARAAYLRHNFTDGLERSAKLDERMGNYIRDAEKNAGARAEADGLLGSAEAQYVNGTGDMCLEYARKAVEKYRAIGDPQAALSAERLIGLCEKDAIVETTTTSTTESTTTTYKAVRKRAEDDSGYAVAVVGAIIFVAVAYLAYQLRRG
ncbi:MAG: hypothetical protein V1875_03020 [Candidatus Altiarchaeota archaeon]